MAEPASVPLAAVVSGFGSGKGAIKDGGGFALCGIEVYITAGHSQAIRLTHNRTDDDLNRKVKIGCHAANDGCLLGILPPKIGGVGLDGVEELGDHGGHAPKMAGALST